MSSYLVTMFNNIVGNNPKGIDSSREEIWRQLRLQAKLILEEAQELYDASVNEDIVEYLDGVVDVWYLREYSDDLLSDLGVNVKAAKDEVCYNNSQKYTTSKELAKNTAETIFGARVEKVCYNGETYYVVKSESGKVQKLLGHQRPDFNKCIPEELKEKLG